MRPSKGKPPKRLDLQGIRALAIIVVLGFHFFPEYCPNGYLGVDQFFVISGFLMCMLLERAENQSPCSSLSIAVDIFTHTWSLSVEIQFYFLVPFIFLLATKIPENYQYFYYCILGSLSFLFAYFSVPTTAFNSVFARIWQFLIGMVVNLLQSQDFQTKSEMLTRADIDELPESEQNLLENQEFEESESESEFYLKSQNSHRVPKLFVELLTLFLFAPLVFITASSVPLPAPTIRPLITIGTGLLMLISENNIILSNRILSYMGDISYSLYLIHWPIYAYWKLTCDGNQLLLICALISSIVLAIITHELYEKWYLKLSSTNVGLLVVLLFSLNVVVINKGNILNHFNPRELNYTRLDNVTANMTVDDAIRLNALWNQEDQHLLCSPTCVYESSRAPLGWCNHTGLSKSRRYKIMTIGNSVNANHARMFYQECGYKARSILQSAAYGCEPLYPSTHSAECYREFNDFEERVRKEKPDYVFIITRFISIGARLTLNVTSDPIYQTMKKQMLKFTANIKYKLFILDALPPPSQKYIGNIAQLVKNGTDPVEIDKLLVTNTEYAAARKRHSQLVKDCGGKCELVDYWPEFYNKTTETIRYFDERGFSYWTWSLHFSPHGLEHVRHLWREICGKL